MAGFKNLIDTEIRFGPLTCIAGLNGVGKSNIFDAIRFVSRLADLPFVEAARETRGGSEVVDLFTVEGDGVMRFDCDILIPSRGVDDFHQPAEASQTFLNYVLELRLETDSNGLPRVRLELERLVYVPRNAAKSRIGFGGKNWRDSVVRTSHRRAPFIETEGAGDSKIVRLSSDRMRDEGHSKRGGGRPTDFLARGLPRTVLSAAQNAEEARTAVLTRGEMRSWKILQLEPSALRQPDDLQAPSTMGSDGLHLPATLYRLGVEGDPVLLYTDLANRLSELVNDVRTIRIDRDDTRRVLRLVMSDRSGLELPASSLSDGTLRFVALSVLEKDTSFTGLVCLEEPENGIHPERMDAMMQLLDDIAVDVGDPVGRDNPLRQVIVSTHSPVIAARTQESELVFADHRDVLGGSLGMRRSLTVRPIRGTWRDRDSPGIGAVGHGEVLQFLGTLRPRMDTQSRAPTVYSAVEPQLELVFGPNGK